MDLSKPCMLLNSYFGASFFILMCIFCGGDSLYKFKICAVNIFLDCFARSCHVGDERPVDESQRRDVSPNSASSCVASDELFNLSDLNFHIQKLEVRLYNFPKPP